MQVSIEKVSGLERRMTVGVPAEEIDSEVTERLRKASTTVRIDGFRKGKVPLKVMRQRFGKGVRQEVVGEVVSRYFQEAVASEQVRPAGQPSIESLNDEPGQDVEFTAVFEVYPEVELEDFSRIAIERPVAEVTDADIDRMIDVLREQNAEWVAVERPAEEGDKVNIDYSGRKDGEPFEGGQAEGSELTLGSGQMIPGFEDAVVGMKAGEEKTVPLTFPEDYHNEELKGAAVEFDIKVNEVQEKKLPELDDEFFAIFGVEEGGLEKFREEVRTNMERELRNAVKNKVKTRIMNQLLELHDVDLPSALVHNEIQNVRRQMLSQFGGGQNIDESMLPDELFSGEAERRVALGLIVARVVEEREITADAEQVRQQVEDIASTYEDPEEVINYYFSNEQLLNSVESAVLEDQVVEHILEEASVTDTPCTYEEAVQPDQPPQQEGEESPASEGDEPGGEPEEKAGE